MKNESRWKTMYVFVILFTAIGLIGISWWDLTHGDELGIQPRPVFDVVNEGEFDTKSMKEGGIGVLGVSLNFRIFPPSTKEESRTVQIIPFDVPSIILRDDNPNRSIKSVCIVSVSLQVSSSISPQTRYRELVNGKPLCHELTTNDRLYRRWDYTWTSDVTGEQEGSIRLDHVHVIVLNKDELDSYEEFNPLVVGANFWFPYDPFDLTLETQVKTLVELDTGLIVYQSPPAIIEFQLLPSGGRPWDITMKNEMIREKDGTDEVVHQETQLNLVRPFLYRFSFPLIIGAMVIFIAMIPQIANPNVETVLGIMVSMPFAIFAVRSLLSPGDQIGQTIIDVAILGLYALLILAGVLLMWRVRRFKKTEGNITNRKKSSRITSR